MRRKGVSLTLETIVVLTLSVLVLTVLLYFFNANFRPAESSIDDLNKQRDLCIKHVNNDIECTKGAETELVRLCTKLNYEKCKTQGGKECVQTCCSLFCPQPLPKAENK
ncbi:MAG: hypothetical protein HYW26_03110 [Candidatus Aenigmarchaeota archaeon]|nr:hypothetical protein [Candidatus Aenigmarchaeota archaeon]